ncbi:unnamed protein product [Angiostrongylus costaricensis]|uniref:ABC transporter permease n=1 Tax=Angiostrongylus costaricensis TaxID=334426 RepID=A0A0R3Q127_ANGCS|nr:unnamed protein product [Angiostrongylus costaricensis]
MLILSRQDLAYLLKKKRYKVMWMAGVLLWSFTYMFITFYCFAVTDEYVNYARTAVLKKFNRNIDDLSLFCVFPLVSIVVIRFFLSPSSFDFNTSASFKEKVNRQTIIYWKATVGVAVMMSMMLLSLILMLFYGVKIMRTLRKMAMSTKTRALQTQLMKALVFQVRRISSKNHSFIP